MSERDRGYTDGVASVWRGLHREAVAVLRLPEADMAAQELAETRAALRRLAEDVGLEADWPADLYLPDVVERIAKAWPEADQPEDESSAPWCACPWPGASVDCPVCFPDEP